MRDALLGTNVRLIFYTWWQGEKVVVAKIVQPLSATACWSCGSGRQPLAVMPGMPAGPFTCGRACLSSGDDALKPTNVTRQMMAADAVVCSTVG
jgi:hypothetical protein